MILPRYTAFRRFFAVPALAISGAASGTAGVVRLAFGSSHGLVTGDTALVEGVLGTTEANGLWSVVRVDASHVELVGTTFAHVYAGGGTALRIMPDGLPRWPGPQRNDGSIDNSPIAASMLRTSGFSETITATSAGGTAFDTAGKPVGPLLDPDKIPTGDAFWPVVITCNALALDAVAGTHEYDWYLSCRRDLGRYMPAGSTTLVDWQSQALVLSSGSTYKSGRVDLSLNMTAVAKLLPGLSGSALLTPAAFATLFRNVHLYVRRRADLAIQWVSLYQPQG